MANTKVLYSCVILSNNVRRYGVEVIEDKAAARFIRIAFFDDGKRRNSVCIAEESSESLVQAVEEAARAITIREA